MIGAVPLTMLPNGDLYHRRKKPAGESPTSGGGTGESNNYPKTCELEEDEKHVARRPLYHAPRPSDVASLRVPLARGLLWAILLGSLLVFSFVTLARPMRWYRDSPHMRLWRDAWAIHYHTRSNVMIDGLAAAQVQLQWGSTLVALLCVAGLAALQRKSPLQHRKQVNHLLEDTWQSCRITVSRVLSYQLPPSQWWLWWCGGLTVKDLLLLLAWVALNGLWLGESLSRALEKVKADKDPWSPYRKSAKTFGWVGTVDLLLLFYPIPRSTFLHWLLDTDFAAMVKYHRWLAHGTLIILSAHALMFQAVWLGTGVWFARVFVWNRDAINHLAGAIAWWTSLVIWACSSAAVRRSAFQVFYAVHSIGFPVFLLFAMMHYKGLVYYIVPGLLLYLLDLTLRWMQCLTSSTTATAAALSADGSVLSLRLDWRQGTDVAPGQYVFLRFPELSSQQHPFSVSQVVKHERHDRLISWLDGKDQEQEQGSEEGGAGHQHHAPTMSAPPGSASCYVHIKASGPWTRQVVQALAGGKGTKVQVEGPYGSTSCSWRYQQAVVLLAGGIGITPLLGILHDIWHRKQLAPGQGPKRVQLVWAVRNPQEVTLLGEDLLDTAREPDSWLQILLHTTASTTTTPAAASKASTITSSSAPSLSHNGAVAGQGQGGRHSVSGLEDVPLTPRTPLLGPPAASVTGLRRLLVSHHVGTVHLCVAALLCFAFSFLALLPPATYDMATLMATGHGPEYCYVGLMQFALLGAAALGAPLLYLLAVHVVRLMNDPSYRSQPVFDTAGGEEGLQGGHAALTQTPGGLCLQGGVEEGHAAVAMAQGRPDMRALLQNVQRQHVGMAEVAVIVSGPRSMVDSAKVVCSELNGLLVGPGEVPYLNLHLHSFEL